MSLKRLKQPVICNAKGEPIVLNSKEQAHANYLQRKCNAMFANALGYEIPITTLTTILKKIAEQKFFEVAPADYLPVRVGEGAWSSQLTSFRSFDQGDAFESGILNTGGQNARLATADSAIDSVSVKVYNWGKTIGWTIFDLEHAAKAGNWDIVSAKEKSRKRNWDLGVQRVCFLGTKGSTGSQAPGLLGLQSAGAAVNVARITKAIKSMSATELSTFAGGVIEDYRDNCNRTAWPTHFVIPESDYNGLATQSSPDFPIKSKLALLEETFQTITRNKQFKILPLAYADNAYSGLGYQIYTLLNYDEESIRVDIPVDYTNTLANSIDNFSFQNVGYGQFTGVQLLRPLELMYFKY